MSVNLIAFTVDGPDRLQNYGVPAYLADGSAAIRSRSQFSQAIGTSWTRVTGGNRICIGNDKIQQTSSTIRVLLLPGAGYRVDPQRRSIDVNVIDLDSCAIPDDRTENEGVVYQFNGSNGAWGTCTCSTESRVSDVRRALDRTIPTPGPDNRYGTDDDGTTDAPEPSAGFLGLLAAQFHDPSYLYCPESPWKGLP